MSVLIYRGEKNDVTSKKTLMSISKASLVINHFFTHEISRLETEVILACIYFALMMSVKTIMPSNDIKHN
jgi:hypothetical protein